MKLYMHPKSTTSRPVLLLLNESRIEYEPVIVDLPKGEQRQEAFAALNPSRKVPVLVDDDFVLTESSAILKYVAEKHELPSYPRDLRQRARVNEILDWFNSNLYRDFGFNFLWPQIYPHHMRKPEAANQATIEWGRDRSEEWLKVLDEHWLGQGRKYLTGDQITIADYFGGPLVSIGDIIRVNWARFPNIDRWMQTMRSLPSWDKVHEAQTAFAASVKDKPFTTL